MAILVTLRDAKQRLALPLDITANDAMLQQILDEAERVVLGYVAQRRDDNAAWTATVAGWTADTAPREVRAAVLMEFADLYRFRGDDDASQSAAATPEYGMLPTRVTALLYRLRDPAVS